MGIYDENWMYVDRDMLNCHKPGKARKFYDKITYTQKSIPVLVKQVEEHKLE